MTASNTSGTTHLHVQQSFFLRSSQYRGYLYYAGSRQVSLNALIGVTTSMTVLLFAMFLLGYLCKHFSHKYQLCRGSHDQTPKPVGADLNAPDPSELEMMDNVAYGPIKLKRRDQQQ